MYKFWVSLIVFLVAITFFMSGVMAVVPFGANLTIIKSENSTIDSPTSVEAIAGNVTELTIYGYSTTQTWQGYFGNVSGTIQLVDSSDNVMYNWSLASPEGEVYASENDSIIWTNIQCFNFTADGTYADDSAQRGATSLHGMNLSQIEAQYNITWDDVDGVNETFALGNNHDLFYTNNLQFSQDECLSTRVYNNTGQGADNNFEEVLLYEPDTRSIVFASILDEEDVLGFDGAYHDFEMLVLEDGHGTDVATRLYYFYVELE